MPMNCSDDTDLGKSFTYFVRSAVAVRAIAKYPFVEIGFTERLFQAR